MCTISVRNIFSLSQILSELIRHAQSRTRGCHKLSGVNQNVHLSTDPRYVL
jgi:hypothetical protein